MGDTGAEHAPWDEFARSQSGTVAREAWFCPSAGERIYVSLFAPATGAPSEGVLVLPCWGMEGRMALEWCHRLARGVVERGAAGVVLHWPGIQDSDGDVASSELARLVEVCRDVIASASARVPIREWATAGISVSAAIAGVAARDLDLRRTILVQPDLDPAAHFDAMQRSGRRAFLAGPLPDGWAFANPIPSGLRAPGVADAVDDALTSYSGHGVVVHYRRPRPAIPPGFDRVSVWGHGRYLFNEDGDHPLLMAALRWYTRACRAAA